MRTAGPAVLISCDPDARALALEELKPVLAGLEPADWLDPGIALVRTRTEFAAFADAVEGARAMFVRHLAPVDREVELTGTEADLELLWAAGGELAPRLDRGTTFAVQARILGTGKLPYRKYTLNEFLSTRLAEAAGALLDTRNPSQVVSVLCTPDRGFVGVSPTTLNRSAWPGGQHRFKAEEGQVSRAEHKLLEALSVFGIDPPKEGLALDLGAAPGGWTRVMRQRELKVVAVDPADLDPRIGRDDNVQHVRKSVRDYAAPAGAFDMLLNDLRMDPRDSVETMLRFRPALKSDGRAVMTLKMPETPGDPVAELEEIRGNIHRLMRSYFVIGARRLYHNRSEVTVALRAA